jgi:hypothetical protein
MTTRSQVKPISLVLCGAMGAFAVSCWLIGLENPRHRIHLVALVTVRMLGAREIR